MTPVHIQSDSEAHESSLSQGREKEHHLNYQNRAGPYGYQKETIDRSEQRVSMFGALDI